MKVNLRDYYVSISIYGMSLVFDGFITFNSLPKSELLGGAEILIGAYIILWGLLFLHFSSDEQLGVLETMFDRFIQKLGVNTAK